MYIDSFLEQLEYDIKKIKILKQNVEEMIITQQDDLNRINIKLEEYEGLHQELTIIKNKTEESP